MAKTDRKLVIQETLLTNEPKPPNEYQIVAQNRPMNRYRGERPFIIKDGIKYQIVNPSPPPPKMTPIKSNNSKKS